MSEGLKKVGNYRLVRKIGSGATSEVFEGRKEGEIERFAIKMIKVRSMSKEQREMIAKEVVIIKSIDHAHIVKLHDTL
jgi:serine/threonine-protein kinase ULK/ATG1